MRKLIFGLVAAMWMALSTTLYAALNMKAGLWETTTTMSGQTAGMEQKCFLQKDIDDLESTVKGVAGKANQPNPVLTPITKSPAARLLTR